MFEICLHLQFPTWYEQNTIIKSLKEVKSLFDNYVFGPLCKEKFEHFCDWFLERNGNTQLK